MTLKCNVSTIVSGFVSVRASVMFKLLSSYLKIRRMTDRCFRKSAVLSLMASFKMSPLHLKAAQATFQMIKLTTDEKKFPN